MSTNRTETILKVAAWPAVVLILVLVFMFLFRSSLEVFITRWESFKMGDVEVKVESEQDKKFLENLLAEREAFILNLRQSVDSLARIIDTLEEDNHQLVHQLEEVSGRLSASELETTLELVQRTHETAQSSSSTAKKIEEKTASQLQTLKVITSSEKYKESQQELVNGFKLLRKERYEEATEAFQQAGRLSPSVQKDHKSLSEFMLDNIPALQKSDKTARKRIYAAVLREYGDKLPADARKILKEIVLDNNP